MTIPWMKCQERWLPGNFLRLKILQVFCSIEFLVHFVSKNALMKNKNYINLVSLCLWKRKSENHLCAACHKWLEAVYLGNLLVHSFDKWQVKPHNRNSKWDLVRSVYKNFLRVPGSELSNWENRSNLWHTCKGLFSLAHGHKHTI